MADHESTMKWKVDVTQLKSAMQDAKRAISLANAEFKTATAGIDKWSKSTTGLEAKLQQLNATLPQQRQILAQLEQQYRLTAENMGENSAEAQRLKIAIENQRATIAKTEANIERYGEQLSEMRKEEEQADTATGKLSKTIEEQQAKVDELKRKYQDAVLQYGKNSDEANALARELDDLSGELAENKRRMAESEKAADNLDNSMDDLDDSTQSASDGFTVMKGALANLVAQGISTAISAMKDLAKQTFEVGANFESAMSKVEAVSGATAGEMDQLTAKAKEMGESTVFSASQSAEAFNYMAMAGWKTEDMLGGIEGIMNLAAASGEDLATTSDIVTDALTAMGYSAKDSGRLADVMAAASSNANTNVKLMGMTFQYAAPIIGALGYNMEDAAVAIGLMANAGIKGEKSGTALRSILTRLSAPPKECAEAMDKLGISLTDSEGNMKSLDQVMQELRKAFEGLSETEQTSTAKHIAGQEAMSGLLAIVRAAPADYNKLTRAVENSSGAASDMAETMTENVSGQITLLRSKVEGIMIKVFEKASGSIRKALDTISKGLDKIDWNKTARFVGKVAEAAANLFDCIIDHGDAVMAILQGIAVAFVTYKAVSIIGSVVTAIQGMITAIKAGETAMAALNATMGLTPVGLIAMAAAAVAGLTVAAVKYAKSADEAKMAQYRLSEEQQTAIDKATELANRYAELDVARREQQASVQSEYAYLESLKDEYNGLIDSNGKVKEGYEDRANFILTRLSEAMGMEVEEIQKIIDENGKLGESIDQVIQKKKAEAMLLANEELYTDAIKNRTSALDELTNAQSAVDEAQKKYNDTQAAADRVMKEYNDLLGHHMPAAASTYLNNHYDIIRANEEAKKAYEAANAEVKKAEDAWIGYNSTIQNYEGLSAAIISGDTEKINNSLLDLQYGFITAETGNEESLKRQVVTYNEQLSSLQQAIQNGTPSVTQDMVDQAQSMVDAAVTELGKLAPQAGEHGGAGGKFFVEGVASQTLAAKKAGNILGVASVTGEKTGSSGSKNTGTTAGSEFSAGVRLQQGAASAAGQTIGSSAKTGAGTGSKGIMTIGDKLGAEFSSGVSSKKGDAKSAGTELGSNANEGAKSYNDDAETSGSNFGKGFWQGIGSWVSSVWSKAKELAKSAWNGLRKGQEEGSPSKLTRRSGAFFGEGYALGIQDMMKPVSDAATDLAVGAVTAMTDALGIHSPSKVAQDQIGRNLVLGIISGINAEKKNAKKSAAELANLYVTEAKSRVSDLKKANKMTLIQEIDFWNQMLGQVKNNSKAYNAALAQLNSAKKSLQTDMQKLTKTYVSDVAEVNEKLDKNIAALKKTYTDAVNQRANELKGTYNLFDSVKYDTSVSKDRLKENMQNQVNALKDYDTTLSALEKRLGSNSALVAELRKMGVSSTNTMKNLNSMSNAELKEYEKLFNERNKLAEKRAKTENAGFKKSTDNQIAKLKKNAKTQIDKLTVAYQKELKKMQTAIGSSGKQVGSAMSAGIKSGLTAGMKGLTATLKKQIQNLVNSVKKQLKIKSPSKVFADQVGKWMPLGIAEGFKASMPKAENTMQSSIMAAVKELKGDLSSTNWQMSEGSIGSISAGVGEAVREQNITFNQNINSPKALDRLTVYRQTNNLLFSAKVRLNNV